MSQSAEEAAEEVAEIVENVIVEQAETVNEVKAEIAVAKAEAAAENAVQAAEQVQIAAQIQVAQIAIEAEQQIAEHEQKVDELEYDQEWLKKTVLTLMEQVEQLKIQLSQQLTPQQSSNQEVPPVLEVQTEAPQDAGEGDHQETVQNPLAEIIPPVGAPRRFKAL